MYDSGGSNISVTLKLSTYKMGTRITFLVDLKQGVWCHGGSHMKGYGHPCGALGKGALWKALEERDGLYAKPHDQLTDADGMRLGELEGIVGEEGGYTAEADAAVLLDGLGVQGELQERKMGELQGGQKVRVLLAQALFGNPTALLLDEPTNNLDLDSVHWLQRYLCDYEGVLIVISHD